MKTKTSIKPAKPARIPQQKIWNSHNKQYLTAKSLSAKLVNHSPVYFLSEEKIRQLARTAVIPAYKFPQINEKQLWFDFDEVLTVLHTQQPKTLTVCNDKDNDLEGL